MGWAAWLAERRSTIPFQRGLCDKTCWRIRSTLWFQACMDGELPSTLVCDSVYPWMVWGMWYICATGFVCNLM